MRYSLWINGQFVCETADEAQAIVDGRSFAATWRKSVVVFDEYRDHIAHVIDSVGALQEGA